MKTQQQWEVWSIPNNCFVTPTCSSLAVMMQEMGLKTMKKLFKHYRGQL